MIKIKHSSKSYGEITLRAIGVIDFIFFEKHLEIDFADFMEAHHPKNFFFDKHKVLYVSEKLEQGVNVSFVAFAPVVEDNLDWQPTPEMSCFAKWKKNKKNPFAISEDKVKEWQDAAGSIVAPDYFLKSFSVEELKAAFKEEHNI